MEPQNNERINLQKAINAHEEVLHALADVIDHTPDPIYTEMLQNIERNLVGLRARAAQAAP
ncbi:MAG TPA: hypothetical protein VF613_17510 [Longimicrobium sp.]|jgi:hypothetical protein